jgi:hypothetical protein
MCDYSLHNVASRPAKVGDRLVTTKFDFLTRGFAAIGEPNVAVCLLPGSEVAFESEVERDHPFGRLLPNMQFGKLGDKVARFRQVNMDRPNTHHDALEFPNGQIVLVTRHCARASGRRCCSCRPLPASRANRKSKCTPLEPLMSIWSERWCVAPEMGRGKDRKCRAAQISAAQNLAHRQVWSGGASLERIEQC